MHPQQIAEREGKGLLITFFIVVLVIAIAVSLSVWGIGAVIQKIRHENAYIVNTIGEMP